MHDCEQSVCLRNEVYHDGESEPHVRTQGELDFSVLHHIVVSRRDEALSHYLLPRLPKLPGPFE